MKVDKWTSSALEQAGAIESNQNDLAGNRKQSGRGCASNENQ